MVTRATHEYAVPTKASFPYGIAVGADGNVYFTEASGNKLGRLIPSSGKIEEFPVSTAASMPWNIVAGPGRWLYFIEKSGNRLVKVRL